MKKLKRITSAVIIMCMIIALSSTCLSAAKDFPDMRGHWAESYVVALTEKGGIDGFPDGKFHPSENVTLPQFVKIVVSINYGEIKPVDDQWASGYLKKAFDLGLIQSQDLSASGPMDRFTAVRIAHNALLEIYHEQDESNTSELVQMLEDYPTNCRDCVNTFEGEVAQCFAKGIITGKPGPVFDGEAFLTRAEASAIIMRMVDEKLRILPERSVIGSDEAPYQSISPEDAKTLLESSKDAVMLDVRGQQEHSAKYIPGSICIPLDTLASEAKSQLPDKQAIIIVYCQVGARSKTACELLSGLGYQYVYHLGGIDNWPYDTVSD